MLINPPMVLGLIVNHWSDKKKKGQENDFIIGCKAVGAKPYFQGFQNIELECFFCNRLYHMDHMIWVGEIQRFFSSKSKYEF